MTMSNHLRFNSSSRRRTKYKERGKVLGFCRTHRECDGKIAQRKKSQNYDRRQAAIEDEQMMIASRWEYLEEIYRIIGENCPTCWFQGRADFDHRLKDCNDFRSKIGMKWSDFRGANIEWEGCRNTC